MDLVPQLSQEPFELEQIYQWLKCASRREEQSINRVFHCSTPGFQDIVACNKSLPSILNPFGPVPQLSQEPFELEQIATDINNPLGAFTVAIIINYLKNHLS